MLSAKQNTFNSYVLSGFLVFALIAFLLPQPTEQFGLKKPNQEPKPKKVFPFHKITHIPIKEDDDLDEDVREFFEKVHHADIKSSQPQVQTDDEEDDDDIEEDRRRLTSGFFGWLFGVKKDDQPQGEETPMPVINDQTETNQNAGKEAKQDAPKEDKTENNGIINWLKSLFKQTAPEVKKAPPKEPVSFLVQYFDRWPFNVIFPINKPQKINVPKRGVGGKWTPGEPISDDDFETLLESFPSFIVNPALVHDIDCKQQLQIWQRQLRGHKLWTLQMLDASAKIPSGILRGNINQLGDFDMCTKIKTSVKITKQVSVRVKGKYCLAHIEIQSANEDLKLAVHLAQGRGLWNSHLNDPHHLAPRYSLINWGVCIPHACQSVVVRDMIDRSLQPYNHTGIYFRVEVNENDCHVRSSLRFRNLLKQNKNIAFTVGYFITFLSAVISSVLIENRNIFKKIWRKSWRFLKPKLIKLRIDLKSFMELAKKSHAEAKAEQELQLKKAAEKSEKVDSEEEEAVAAAASSESNEDSKINEEKDETTAEEEQPTEKTNEEDDKAVPDELSEDAFDKSESHFKDVILAFSPKRSIATLLAPNASDTEFAIFPILKIFCTFMLYVCMKYLMLGHLPLLGRDKLIKSMDTPFSIFYRSPIIYFDVLLIISGFIKAYQMCEEMESKCHIYALKRLIMKVLRFLPTLYAVLLFQTWILPHLESGPVWNNIIGTQSKLCEESMWRNIFGVQNAINFEETCSPMTIQHAVELQMFLLAPLIVWLFYCNSDIGFFIYGGIHMMSVAARYSRTNTEHLSSTLFHGIHISKFYRTANLLFSSPVPRATAFLIGIGGGILYKTSANEWRSMSRVGLTSGWLVTFLALCYCFWYPSTAVRLDYIYNSVDAASYASWCPLVLGFAITWIIFMVQTRNVDGEPTALHRLLTSRPIMILSRITYPTQLISYVAVLFFTSQQKESRPFSLNDLVNLGEIFIILVLAATVSLLIDIPMQRVAKVLVNIVLPDKPPSVMGSDEVTSEDEKDPNQKEEINEKENDTTGTEYEAKEDFVAGGIWGADPEEEEKLYLARRKSSLKMFNSNQSDAATEETSKSTADVETAKVETEAEAEEEEVEEEEEEVEVEEETEITEEEEVVKRPVTPEKPPTPPPTTTRRRRFN